MRLKPQAAKVTVGMSDTQPNGRRAAPKYIMSSCQGRHAAPTTIRMAVALLNSSRSGPELYSYLCGA